MKQITNKNLEHFIGCLKSGANDPLAWINKDRLNEEQFFFLNDSLEKISGQNQISIDENDENHADNTIRSGFVDHETFRQFLVFSDEWYKTPSHYRKNWLEAFFGYLTMFVSRFK